MTQHEWLLGPGWYSVEGNAEAQKVFTQLQEHRFEVYLFEPGTDEFALTKSTQKRVYFGRVAMEFLEERI